MILLEFSYIIEYLINLKLPSQYVTQVLFLIHYELYGMLKRLGLPNDHKIAYMTWNCIHKSIFASPRIIITMSGKLSLHSTDANHFIYLENFSRR